MVRCFARQRSHKRGFLQTTVNLREINIAWNLVHRILYRKVCTFWRFSVDTEVHWTSSELRTIYKEEIISMHPRTKIFPALTRCAYGEPPSAWLVHLQFTREQHFISENPPSLTLFYPTALFSPNLPYIIELTWISIFGILRPAVQIIEK
jgi:hypothetical protein